MAFVLEHSNLTKRLRAACRVIQHPCQTTHSVNVARLTDSDEAREKLRWRHECWSNYL